VVVRERGGRTKRVHEWRKIACVILQDKGSRVRALPEAKHRLQRNLLETIMYTRFLSS